MSDSDRKLTFKAPSNRIINLNDVRIKMQFGFGNEPKQSICVPVWQCPFMEKLKVTTTTDGVETTHDIPLRPSEDGFYLPKTTSLEEALFGNVETTQQTTSRRQTKRSYVH